jgi:hypothetical protein
MRIISKHKDYYDCMRRGDTDNVYTFNRIEKDYQPSYSKLKKNASWPYTGDKYNYCFITVDNKKVFVESFIIGFCGKLYNGIAIKHYSVSFPHTVSSKCTYMYENEAYDYLENIL